MLHARENVAIALATSPRKPRRRSLLSPPGLSGDTVTVSCPNSAPAGSVIMNVVTPGWTFVPSGSIPLSDSWTGEADQLVQNADWSYRVWCVAL